MIMNVRSTMPHSMCMYIIFYLTHGTKDIYWLIDVHDSHIFHGLKKNKKIQQDLKKSWLDKLIITDVLDRLCKDKRIASWLFM